MSCRGKPGKPLISFWFTRLPPICVDNFVDSSPPLARGVRKIKGLAALPTKNAIFKTQ
jgi:hypothetical protein